MAGLDCRLKMVGDLNCQRDNPLFVTTLPGAHRMQEFWVTQDVTLLGVIFLSFINISSGTRLYCGIGCSKIRTLGRILLFLWNLVLLQEL